MKLDPLRASSCANQTQQSELPIGRTPAMIADVLSIAPLSSENSETDDITVTKRRSLPLEKVVQNLYDILPKVNGNIPIIVAIKTWLVGGQRLNDKTISSMKRDGVIPLEQIEDSITKADYSQGEKFPSGTYSQMRNSLLNNKLYKLQDLYYQLLCWGVILNKDDQTDDLHENTLDHENQKNYYQHLVEAYKQAREYFIYVVTVQTNKEMLALYMKQQREGQIQGIYGKILYPGVQQLPDILHFKECEPLKGILRQFFYKRSTRLDNTIETSDGYLIRVQDQYHQIIAEYTADINMLHTTKKIAYNSSTADELEVLTNNISPEYFENMTDQALLQLGEHSIIKDDNHADDPNQILQIIYEFYTIIAEWIQTVDSTDG